MIKTKKFMCIITAITTLTPNAKGMDENSDEQPKKNNFLKTLLSSHAKESPYIHISAEPENNPETLYNLGLQLTQKRGSKKPDDKIKATEYFRQAALQNHQLALSQLDILDSQGAQEIRQGRCKQLYFDLNGQKPRNLSEGDILNYIGLIYDKGNDKTPKNLHEANKYFELSANLGNKNGQYNLGISYYSGTGLSQNFDKAFNFLNLCANQKDSKAQLLIGFMYDEGKGIPQDKIKAFKYYKLAADQGNEKGQFYVANMYWEGKYIKKDPGEGLKYFKLSAHQGYEEALDKLDILTPHTSLIIRRDLAKAKSPNAVAYFQNLLINIPHLNKNELREAHLKIDLVLQELIAKDAKYIRFSSLAEGNLTGMMSEEDGSYKGVFKSCPNDHLKIVSDTISKELNKYQILVGKLKKPGTFITCLDLSNKYLPSFKKIEKIFTIDRITSTYFSLEKININILSSKMGINTLEELNKLYKIASNLMPGIEIFIAQYSMENNRPSLDLWINTILKIDPIVGGFLSCYLEKFPQANQKKKYSLSKQQSLYLENLRIYFDDCQRDLINDIKYMKSLKNQFYKLIKETTDYRNYLFLMDIGLMSSVSFQHRSK